MNIRHKKRLKLIILFLVGFALVVALVLYALRQNINLFYTPTQIAEGAAPLGVRIRIGGMVEKGTLKRENGLRLQFSITDFENSVLVSFEGILPDLFKEAQGVVADGYLQKNKIFIADEILAKHDETYMPPEVKKSLKTKNKGNE